MRPASVLFCAFLLISTICLLPSAAFATGTALRPSAETKPANAPATVKYSGRVLSPDGPLAGAVVEVPGTKLMAVTNAKGEFNLNLPARRAPLRLTASYAGFEDESLTLAPGEKSVTLELATPKTIKVAHDQQLNAYLKNARHEAHQSLKTL